MALRSPQMASDASWKSVGTCHTCNYTIAIGARLEGTIRCDICDKMVQIVARLLPHDLLTVFDEQPYTGGVTQAMRQQLKSRIIQALRDARKPLRCLMVFDEAEVKWNEARTDIASVFKLRDDMG